MASEQRNRAAFDVQAGYCEAMAAPVTARIARALGLALSRDTQVGRKTLDWTGEPVADALALRLVGGLHALHRAGADAGLSRVFDGDVVDDDEVVRTLRNTLAAQDAVLLPWLDTPPQTNEPMRSGALMTGLLHLAARYGPRLEVLEIGSSAGLNLLMADFRFDLGGVVVGPAGSRIAVEPRWEGPPPPRAEVEIVGSRGVDVAPVDITREDQAERLAAYVWVDAVDRQERLGRAIAVARERGVALDRGDAADWVEARLAEPQPAGVTRVLMHSVVWQYLGDGGRARIAASMTAAGARATAERPLGWVMMEPNRDLNRQEVRVRGWPGARPMELVATAHAHGAWIRGCAPPYDTADYVMRVSG